MSYEELVVKERRRRVGKGTANWRGGWECSSGEGAGWWSPALSGLIGSKLADSKVPVNAGEPFKTTGSSGKNQPEKKKNFRKH